MNITLVSGTFDENGGKESSVLTKMYMVFTRLLPCATISIVNGGHIDNLNAVDFNSCDVLFWAPNVSNDLPKIVPDIKSINPRLLLISSKRVVEKEYRESDVIGRLLKTKSNLGLMITKPDDYYNFQLLDPLGNQYCNTPNIDEMVNTMIKRIIEVRRLNRVGSVPIGNKQEFEINPEFIKFIQYSATEFTKHVNAINPNRLLGNASTRCTYGFPAQKQDERIFVTQRNIDKELINTNGFVEVTNNEKVVEYYGDKKPSVDTPIQVRLFNYYHNINYMVHGHVYVEDVLTTESKIPCGYVEEFDEVIEQYPDRDMDSFAINLKGHGCLIMCRNVEDLWKWKYTSRPFPEN